MRFLLILALVMLGGCSIMYDCPTSGNPECKGQWITMWDLEPEHADETKVNHFTWGDETKAYVLRRSDDPNQIVKWCGYGVRACIIYTDDMALISTSKRTWDKELAHELNHYFGISGRYIPVPGGRGATVPERGHYH